MKTSIPAKSKKKSRICSKSPKRRFRDHKEAIRALHGAKAIRRREIEFEGASSRNEKRTYPCADCRGWHLTSQPIKPQNKAAA